MTFYGWQLSQNIELPKPLTDYEDDPLQMAGNVIISSGGNIVQVHASQYPSDRPTVEDVISTLKKLQNTWKGAEGNN